jgi:hypothetical protein
MGAGCAVDFFLFDAAQLRLVHWDIQPGWKPNRREIEEKSIEANRHVREGLSQAIGSVISRRRLWEIMGSDFRPMEMI